MLSKITDKFTGKQKARAGLRPGEKCPVSGQYKNSITKFQATCVKGEPMPPGPAGTIWRLIDVTKHAD